MKLSNKKRFLIPSILTATIIPASIGLVAASCTETGSFESIQTAGYSDSMRKLADGTVTLSGAWSDARFYAGEYEKDLFAIGATDFISNDGVQSRHDLKKGDIEAIQQLFITAVKKASEDQKNKNENSNLVYKDKNGKIKSVFNIYNHDGYTALSYDSEITYNIKGEKKKAYKNTPTGDSEYLKYDADTKKITSVGSKELKIQFIPSTDATLVQQATEKISKYFKEELKINNIKISVSSSYNAAAEVLKSGSIDVSFLPVDSWATYAGDSNFILQAGRDVQIIDPYVSLTNTSNPKINDEKILIEAINHYKQFNKDSENKLYINKDKSKNPKEIAQGYPKELKDTIDELTKDNADLPKVGFYRSYIYANKNSKIYELVTKALNEQGSNWELNWEDVKEHIIYGYTSTSSTASFVYPEQWFKKHFKGFKSLLAK